MDKETLAMLVRGLTNMTSLTNSYKLGYEIASAGYNLEKALKYLSETYGINLTEVKLVIGE